MTVAEFRAALEVLLRKGLVVGEFDEAANTYRFRSTGKQEGRAA